MQTQYLIIILISVTLIWLSVLTFYVIKIVNSLKVKPLTDINNNKFSRLGLVRFNPFNETGGDNSFVLCFLDDKLNGVLLTGLHTREKTRMYAKKVRNGKAEHELSKEESKAIEEALK